MYVQPTVAWRREDDRSLPLLVWRFPAPVRAIASSVFGGGIGERNWVINATVPATYTRADPAGHVRELADRAELDGAGVGLLTAVDVATAVTTSDDGVFAVATVGLGHPAWAAAADGHLRAADEPGTINVVAWVAAPLTDAAMVNAVATATEAKAQALWQAGLAATGTASDALCIATPVAGDADQYGGPRSVWGARLARAVHGAVLAGALAWQARHGHRPVH
jgi:adenosylcobinamide hydrolase